MGVLTEYNLKKRINKNGVAVYPFIDSNVTGLGIDLTIGSLKPLTETSKFSETETHYIIPPRCYLLVITKEHIWLSEKYMGTIHSRGTLAAKGIYTNATNVDPNFSGQMIMSLINVSNKALKIEKNQTYITLIIHEVKTTSQISRDEVKIKKSLRVIEDMLKEKTVGKDEDIRLAYPIHLLHDVERRGEPDKKIAVVFAEGEIHSGANTRDSIGSEGIVADLDEASKDETVKAIVIRINSPGGDALAADVIWRKIKKIDETIPVVVSFGDVAASGGYYMAAGARYIVSEPTTITGSIGVFGIMFDTQKFFKSKLGVNFDQVGTHPYADIGNFNREMTEHEKTVIQDSVNRVYGRFLKVVKDGREFKDQAKVEELAEGRIWSGVRAKELGLVDELGGLILAVEKAGQLGELKKPYAIEVFPKNDDPISMLLERFAAESSIAIFPAWLTDLATKAQQYSTTLNLKPGAYTRMPYDLDIH